MFDNTHCFWFLLGFVPYWVERKRVRAGWQVTLRALFWSLTIIRRSYKRHRRRWTRTNWRFRLPVVEKLRQAVWAAVMTLHK